jgi:hypothetical protein
LFEPTQTVDHVNLVDAARLKTFNWVKQISNLQTQNQKCYKPEHPA